MTDPTLTTSDNVRIKLQQILDEDAWELREGWSPSNRLFATVDLALSGLIQKTYQQGLDDARRIPQN